MPQTPHANPTSPAADESPTFIAGVRADIIASTFDSIGDFRDWHPDYTHDPPIYTFHLTYCASCKDLYFVTPYAARHSYFCGPDCREQWYTVRYNDSIDDIRPHLNLRDESRAPDRLKADIRDESDYACSHCGVPQDAVKLLTGNSQRLNVHHIVPYTRFLTHEAANHSDNLTALDPDCHKKADDFYNDLNDTYRNSEFTRAQKDRVMSFLPAHTPPDPEELDTYTR